jgi:hypothetical protein
MGSRVDKSSIIPSEQASFFRVTLSVDDPLQSPKIVWKLRKFSQKIINVLTSKATKGSGFLTFRKKSDFHKWKMASASNLQKEKQNRRDSMCWEKKIKICFSSRAMMKEVELGWLEAGGMSRKISFYFCNQRNPINTNFSLCSWARAENLLELPRWQP